MRIVPVSEVMYLVYLLLIIRMNSRHLDLTRDTQDQQIDQSITVIAEQ